MPCRLQYDWGAAGDDDCGETLETNAPAGRHTTTFRVVVSGAPAGIAFLQGLLDDGSALPPLGWVHVADNIYEVSTQGCFVNVTGR